MIIKIGKELIGFFTLLVLWRYTPVVSFRADHPFIFYFSVATVIVLNVILVIPTKGKKS